METNRDRLLKRNEYDLLCDIQLGCIYGQWCVLDLITPIDHSCPPSDPMPTNGEERWEVCKKCIENWLNREEK